MAETIRTPLCDLLGIKYPILLAGMNQVAGAELAAAVTNAGGLGMVGGVGYTPTFLRNVLKELKEKLDDDKKTQFGVDLLLPKVGGSARKTNKDYTEGKLPELIDIIVESGARLFVCAVGVPPKWAVNKLHAAGIPVMNMIGSPRHVKKALAAGVDLLCAQGGEGGGHTGSVATSVLIPQVVDLCRGARSPLTGGPVHVLAAGGIFDGRGLAMGLSLGAQGVWVGTRFVASTEAGCPKRHSRAVVDATTEDTVRTIIYTGRPMRILKNEYAMNWEDNRADEIKDLTSRGILPIEHDFTERMKAGEEISPMEMVKARPLLMGQAAGACGEILPAKEIVEQMITEAVAVLRNATAQISRL